MVDPQWTAQHDTPNKSLRQNVPRKGAVLHHAALTDLDYLRRLEMGEKELSSSGIVKDDNREQMIASDAYRAWSLSDGFWDSSLRSVETCNESTVGWTVSDASHRSLGRLVAFWAERDEFYPHRDGDPSTWTVIGHREVYTIHGGSYGTACPGGMDLDLVTRYAQEFLAGTATPAPIPQGGTMFIVHHVNGTAQAKYLASEFSKALVPAKNLSSANLPVVRIDGDGAKLDAWRRDEHAPLVDRNLAAIAGAIPAGTGGTGPTAAAIADATADEIDARTRTRLG